VRADAGLKLHAVVSRFVKSLIEDHFVFPIPRHRKLGNTRNRASAAWVFVAISVYIQLQGMRII
jgi:hypothetical protein